MNVSKQAENLYSDIQLVKIALNVIRNTNGFEKGQSD